MQYQYKYRLKVQREFKCYFVREQYLQHSECTSQWIVHFTEKSFTAID